MQTAISKESIEPPSESIATRAGSAEESSRSAPLGEADKPIGTQEDTIREPSKPATVGLEPGREAGSVSRHEADAAAEHLRLDQDVLERALQMLEEDIHRQVQLDLKLELPVIAAPQSSCFMMPPQSDAVVPSMTRASEFEQTAAETLNGDSVEIQPFAGDCLEQEQLLEDSRKDNQQAPQVQPVSEGLMRAGNPLISVRELSINQDNFTALQDQAFGKAGVEPGSLPASEPDQEKSRNLRASREFLKAKVDDLSDQQHMSQKLRALPVSSVAQGAAMPAPSPRGIITKKRLTAGAVLLIPVCFLCLFARTGRSYLNDGYRAYNAGHYKESLSLFDHALSLQPDFPEAQLCKARALHALQQPGGALKFYNQVLDHDQDNIVALEGRAAIYSANGQWLSACEDFERLLSLKGGDFEAWHWYAYGCALSSSGRDRKAAQAFGKALEKNPTDQSALSLCAYSWRKAREPGKAAEQATRLLELAPSDRDAMLERARDYLDAGDLARARADVDTLLVRFPDDAEIHFVLGQIYAREQNADAARAQFAYVLQRRPQWAPNVRLENDEMKKRNQAALTTSSQGRSKATVLAPVAFDKTPFSQWSMDELMTRGYANLSCGKAEHASAILREAVRRQPNYFQARKYLAHALAASLKPVSAEEQLKLVWEHSGWSAQDENVLAAAYARAGMPDRAIACYEHILSKDAR